MILPHTLKHRIVVAKAYTIDIDGKESMRLLLNPTAEAVPAAKATKEQPGTPLKG